MKKNLCFACCALIVGIAVDQWIGGRVSAQAPLDGQKKCDYTFIGDNGEPNIGKNGEIKYDDSWKAVVESGWTLKMAGGGGSTYIFEKCR